MPADGNKKAWEKVPAPTLSQSYSRVRHKAQPHMRLQSNGFLACQVGDESPGVPAVPIYSIMSTAGWPIFIFDSPESGLKRDTWFLLTSRDARSHDLQSMLTNETIKTPFCPKHVITFSVESCANLVMLLDGNLFFQTFDLEVWPRGMVDANRTMSPPAFGRGRSPDYAQHSSEDFPRTVSPS